MLELIWKITKSYLLFIADPNENWEEKFIGTFLLILVLAIFFMLSVFIVQGIIATKGVLLLVLVGIYYFFKGVYKIAKIVYKLEQEKDI